MTNIAGIKLIKKYEGFLPYLYLCPAMFPTIGYGHLCKEGDFYLHRKNLHDIRKNMIQNHLNKEMSITISEIEGEKLLLTDLKIAEHAVSRLINVPLTDNQFSALTSFTFNLGSGALQRSTLRQKLNRGGYIDASEEFLKWVYVGHKKINGLIRRRNDERILFMS